MEPTKTESGPEAFYTQQRANYQAKLSGIKQRLLYSSILRLLLFVVLVTLLYYGYPDTQMVWVTLVLGVISFVFLVSRHSRLSYQKAKFQKLMAYNQLELDVMDNDWSGLDAGSEFIDVAHPYSHDIDLFGERSFFQYCNRTVTLAGKQKLAALLTNNDITRIEERQEAIKNLSQMPEWRQNFCAIADLVKVFVTVPSILRWMHTYKPFVPKIMRYLPTVFTAVSVGIVGLMIFGVLTYKPLLFWLLTGYAITGIKIRSINRLYLHSGQIKDTFEQYYKLVEEIENTRFSADLLQAYQRRFSVGKDKASVILKQFATILNAFDQRNNMLFGFLANGLLLWDLRQCFALEQWMAKYHDKVAQWFELIAHFDALNALGNFAFNHPNYQFPKLVTAGPILEAQQLGHPLIDPKKRVSNDMRIDAEQFLIITGANMAGKSTFLRTVALQIVMANVGLPICAKSCTYRPIKLLTSMRTSDSLREDASYFFSELTQLKRIVDALAHEAYFVILDEILKGTNSKDKASGSRKFVERLVRIKSTGIIATHDLSLCAIADELPQVRNCFFDAQIVNDELYFDYLFKAGVCQNMNASFLLKKMGIV